MHRSFRGLKGVLFAQRLGKPIHVPARQASSDVVRRMVTELGQHRQHLRRLVTFAIRRNWVSRDFLHIGPVVAQRLHKAPRPEILERALVGRRSLCKIAHQRSQCRGVTATATSSGFPFLELIQPAAVRLLGHLIVYGLPRPSVTCSETSSSNGALSIGFQPSSGGPRIEHFLSWRRRSASEAPVRTTASARIDSACTGRAQHPFAPALTSAQ
jgi:hypothetical protein